MLANDRNFERRAAKYLASKVLTYDNWCDSITQGRKGDVLALYRLCMLFSRHAVVHLHNSTFSEKGDQECPGHDFLMSRSAVHYVSSKSEA